MKRAAWVVASSKNPKNLRQLTTSPISEDKTIEQVLMEFGMS
jgi:hypothetical protein